MNDDFLAAGILWKINRVFLDANKFVTVERDISEMALKNIPIFVVSNCCSRERSKIYLYQKKKERSKIYHGSIVADVWSIIYLWFFRW